VLRSPPMAYSLVVFWADTSNLICYLMTTTTSAHGFNETTCAAISVWPSGYARSRWLARDASTGGDRLGRRAGRRYRSADWRSQQITARRGAGSIVSELTMSGISCLSTTAQDRAAAGDGFPAQQRRAGADG